MDRLPRRPEPEVLFGRTRAEGGGRVGVLKGMVRTEPLVMEDASWAIVTHSLSC